MQSFLLSSSLWTPLALSSFSCSIYSFNYSTSCLFLMMILIMFSDWGAALWVTSLVSNLELLCGDVIASLLANYFRLKINLLNSSNVTLPCPMVNTDFSPISIDISFWLNVFWLYSAKLALSYFYFFNSFYNSSILAYNSFSLFEVFDWFCIWFA